MEKPNTKFFLDKKNNNVYKLTNDSSTLLKLSPWEIGEDRRVFNFEKKEKKFVSIPFHKAMELINEQFANYERTWEFNGKRYKILNSSEKGATYLDGIGQYIKEVYHRIYENGYVSVSVLQYYLCWFRGKLYWMDSDWKYYPQVQLYKFEDINKMPSWDDFAQWTNVKNCKVIYEDNA